jgi:hypothetical protein
MTVEKTQTQVNGADFESADREALSALAFRTRAAVLWIALAVALASAFLLGVFEPGAIEEMLGGELEGEPLTEALGFFMAMLVILPLGMAAVSLLIGDRVNRYVNLIVGLGYTLFGCFMAISDIAGGHFNGHVLMVVVACVLGFLIVGLGLIGIRQPTEHHSPST